MLLLMCLQLGAYAQVNQSTLKTKSHSSAKNKSKKKKGSKKDKYKLKESNKPTPLKLAPAKVYSPLRKNGKVITGNIKSLRGFRICIYNGNSRVEALKVKQQFATAYPKISSYVTYNSPYYKVKVGDFADKNQAQKELKKLVVKYSSAFVAPDIVTIKQIEVRKVGKARVAKKPKTLPKSK